MAHLNRLQILELCPLMKDIIKNASCLDCIVNKPSTFILPYSQETADELVREQNELKSKEEELIKKVGMSPEECNQWVIKYRCSNSEYQFNNSEMYKNIQELCSITASILAFRLKIKRGDDNESNFTDRRTADMYIKNHTIYGSYELENLKTKCKIETLSGKYLHITVDNLGNVLVNGAPVVKVHHDNLGNIYRPMAKLKIKGGSTEAKNYEQLIKRMKKFKGGAPIEIEKYKAPEKTNKPGCSTGNRFSTLTSLPVDVLGYPYCRGDIINKYTTAGNLYNVLPYEHLAGSLISYLHRDKSDPLSEVVPIDYSVLSAYTPTQIVNQLIEPYLDNVSLEPMVNDRILYNFINSPYYLNFSDEYKLDNVLRYKLMGICGGDRERAQKKSQIENDRFQFMKLLKETYSKAIRGGDNEKVLDINRLDVKSAYLSFVKLFDTWYTKEGKRECLSIYRLEAENAANKINPFRLFQYFITDKLHTLVGEYNGNVKKGDQIADEDKAVIVSRLNECIGLEFFNESAKNGTSLQRNIANNIYKLLLLSLILSDDDSKLFDKDELKKQLKDASNLMCGVNSNN